MPNPERRGLDLVTRSARVEASLWRRYRIESEATCREALFDRYVGIARTIAARCFYRRRPPRPELADFQQFAYEGLLQAIDRFNPLLGVPFEAYSKRRIVGSIADGIGQMSEVDAQVTSRRRMEQERLRSLARSSDRPSAKAGPALAELAELAASLALGLMLEHTSQVSSEEIADPAPSAYETLAYHQMKARLAQAVDALPEKERTILRQHYQNGLSFAQIAQLLGLSKGRISQLHSSALQRLRKKIGRSD